MKRLLAISLLLVLRSRAGEYADVTAEIQMDEGLADGGTRYTVRCLVGTNSWQIEGAFPPNRTSRSWFTGGKVVEQDVLNQATFSVPPERRGQVSLHPRTATPASRFGKRTF